jgi:uncharacterized membrane protein (DUF485 family)
MPDGVRTESASDDQRLWHELEQGEDFKDLVHTRRRFVVPALLVFSVWFGGFLVLSGYARDFMARKAIGSVTWAYVLALSLIVMTWAIAVAYLRFADRRLAPLVDRTIHDMDAQADGASNGRGALR